MQKKSNKNSLVYIRCRFCGQVFKGDSEDALEDWSEHLARCKKKHNQ